MNSSLSLFLFVTLMFSGKVLAREDVIATITSDDNKQVFNMVVQSDDELNTIKAFYKDNYLDGKRVDRELLPSAELLTSGFVLDQRGERTVLSLKSDNFDNERGGLVTIDTLFNGVNGQRKEYEMELTQSKDGWKLFKGGKIISKLHILVNKKFLLGAVGIKDILMK
ncbi:MAG: hypothetical protein H7336_09220 [Bacteriovorax sp.]|nr:hypothetical protein [Bacteriovorax sp.]